MSGNKGLDELVAELQREGLILLQSFLSNVYVSVSVSVSLLHHSNRIRTWLLYIDLCAGVQLYGGPRASALLKIAETKSFHTEYSSLACTIEIVDDVIAAINHIHENGRQVLVPLQGLFIFHSIIGIIKYLILYQS